MKSDHGRLREEAADPGRRPTGRYGNVRPVEAAISSTGWLSDGCGTGGQLPQTAAYGSSGLAVAHGDAITFRSNGRCHTLHMEPGPVRGLAREGQLIAAGGDAGTFRVWDMKRRPGKPYELDPAKDPKGYRYQYGVAVSPGGTLLAAGGYSNTIRAWAMTAGGPAPLRSWQATGTVWALAFSPDHRTLAIGADRVVELARLDGTGGVQRFAALSAPVTALAYGDKGRTLAVGTKDGTLELWDVRTHRRTLALTTHQGPVRALHFAPAGDRIAVVGEPGSARWWTLGADWAQSRACQTASAPEPREWQRLIPDVNRAEVLGAISCRTS
ncbi:WD40 repeat domain-containing protein [Streptomyces coeruleorubidus]